MRMSLAEYLECQRRVQVRESRALNQSEPSKNATRETGKDGLHEQIIEWCNAQWPRVKYIHARTDQKSTIGVGIHDFTLYMPQGRILNVECKANGKKATQDQLNWAKELSMLGHRVDFVWSFDQFLTCVELQTKTPPTLAGGGTSDSTEIKQPERPAPDPQTSGS